MAKARRLVGWILLLGLGGCGLDEGSPRATVRFEGTYTDGKSFAEGRLTFDPPGGGPFGDAVAGMRRGERRQVEIPLPECPGSARFVEFESIDGADDFYRYRRDRGPLRFELKLTDLCVPVQWVVLPGHTWSSGYEIFCRGTSQVDPTLETERESAPLAQVPPKQHLDRALLEASYGWGKDREVASVEALLEAGADPDAVDASGRSALALAAETGNRAIPRLLFLRGAQLEGSKFEGPFALHRAAADGQIEILRALLAQNTQTLNSLDECGFTPLLWALRNESSALFDCIPGFPRNYEDVIVELLERGSDPRVRQGVSSGVSECVGQSMQPGSTPLHYAAAVCYERAAHLLLANGAEVDVSDDIGDTPLMAAAQTGCPELVALLLDRGAGLETEDRHGSGSALVHAIMRNSFTQDHVDTVALLLERGATPRMARDELRSWLDSETGRGFGRKGLTSARKIARMLWWSEMKGMFARVL